MMKTLTVILIFNSLWIFSQTKEELDNAMLSKDEYKIAYFIKKYPNDPNIPFLKKKLDSYQNKICELEIEFCFGW